MVVSPDPARWRDGAAVPGAFIGLPREGGRAAEFVAARKHAGCTAVPPRTGRQAGIDWVIAAFSCADGRGDVVETAGTSGAGLVFVQITPPVGSGPTFVDTMLAGVRVH
jgi:hypothetical protein